jgi:hypothetical protein
LPEEVQYSNTLTTTKDECKYQPTVETNDHQHLNPEEQNKTPNEEH